MESDLNSTRRTGAVRTSGRAARVVEDVLTATAQELGRVGFAALRVEDVAARSGVNKTTIYRRWPTRADLVAAAIRHTKTPAPIVAGMSLRDEVLGAARAFMSFHASPLGRGIVRVIQTEIGHPELEPVVRALRKEARQSRIELVLRAIDRGELPKDTDAKLVADLLFGPIVLRAVTFNERVDEAFVLELLDLVVTGLVHRATRGRVTAPRRRPASKPPKR